MDQMDVQPSAGGRSITERMMGAATLDIATYEDVEHDTDATAQAAIVVGIVALCAAIGSLGAGIGPAVGGIVAAYIGWLIWAGVTYLIGDKLLGGTATWGELLRTLGFAQTPGILRIFGIIPFLGWIASLVAFVWMLVTGVVAIRQALDFSTGKAILTAVLGVVAYVVVAGVLAAITGVGSMAF